MVIFNSYVKLPEGSFSMVFMCPGQVACPRVRSSPTQVKSLAAEQLGHRRLVDFSTSWKIVKRMNHQDASTMDLFCIKQFWLISGDSGIIDFSIKHADLGTWNSNMGNVASNVENLQTFCRVFCFWSLWLIVILVGCADSFERNPVKPAKSHVKASSPCCLRGDSEGS